MAALRAMLPPSRAPGRSSTSGCGEGRAARELLKLGYRGIIGVERSPTLAAAAAAAAPGVPVLIGDAAALPVADESADLVLACMSLLDMDDFAGAVSEIGRVLRPGGAAVPGGGAPVRFRPGRQQPCTRMSSA